MRTTLPLFTLLTLLLLFSCRSRLADRQDADMFSHTEKSTLWIDGPTEEGAIGILGNPMTCYRVYEGRRLPAGDIRWDTLCQHIGGFEYEPGYRYKIRVARHYYNEFTLQNVMDLPSDHVIEMVSVKKKISR